jgi:O-antigen/teichoic acid export membrane protein
MSGLRRNAFFGALGFGVPAVVTFVAYPILLRALGPSGFGLYVLATSLSGSLAILEFGFASATIRYVAERWAERDKRGVAETITSSLLFYVMLGLLSVALFWMFAPWIARWAGVAGDLLADAPIAFRLAAVQFLFSYVNGVAIASFKGLQRFDYATAFAVTLTSLAWGGGVAGVLWAPIGITGVMAIAVTANALTAFLSWAALLRMLRRMGVSLRGSPPRVRVIRGMLGFGVYMSVNSVAGIAMRQVMQLILANALSAAAVAAYAAGVQVVSRINALIGAMSEGLMPAAASLVTGDSVGLAKLRRAYHRAVVVAILGSSAMAACLYVLSPWLVPWWLRSGVAQDVVMVIRVSCVGLAVNGATPVAYHFLNGAGKPQWNTLFVVANPLVFYGTLALIAKRGVTLYAFAAAGSVGLVITGIAFLAFIELFVWREFNAGRIAPVSAPPEVDGA